PAAGAGGGVGGNRALLLPRADHLVVRRHLHAVRHDLHAWRRLRPAQGRAYPNRLLLRQLERAHQGDGRFDFLPRVLLPVAHPVSRGERQRGVVRLDHQRDFRADPVAPDPLALQGRGAGDLRAPHAARRVGGDQERVRLAHGRGARAQGKDRDMTGDVLIGLIMLIVMIGAIFIGIQISFTLLFLALTFGYLALGRVVFDLAYFQTIGMMKEELLAAVPLFIFMGFITEQAGLMERLFSALRMLLAPVRGSLYVVVILTSTVFAMATDIVDAAVTM